MNEKTLTLAIETAIKGGSLALLDANEVRAVWSGADSFAHSSNLIVEINNLFETSGNSLEQIRSIAVAIGPGSFTGLRVGLATAKGLAAALKIQIKGIPTLAALCESVEDARSTSAIISAGRNNVFAQTFSRDSNGKLAAQIGLINGTLPAVFDKLNAPQTVVALPELHCEIRALITTNYSTIAEIVSPPENLAVHVGRAAVNEIAPPQNRLSLIYGRDADAKKPVRQFTA